MARVFVNDSTLTDIADAIREKNGTKDTYKPSQMADAVRAIESGEKTEINRFCEVLSVVPIFDETWTTSKFTLTSSQTGNGFDVPNPSGKVPNQIFVIKLDIDYSITPQVIGGYNIGNIITDNNDNRTFKLGAESMNGIMQHELMRAIQVTNWNFQSSSYGASTAEVIKIRSGTYEGGTVWLAGEYILAVK